METLLEFDDILETQEHNIPGLIEFYTNYAKAILQKEGIYLANHYHGLDSIEKLLTRESQRGNTQATDLLYEIRNIQAEAY